MKYIQVYPLFLMPVFLTSCGQNQTNAPNDNIKSSRANYSEAQLKDGKAVSIEIQLSFSLSAGRQVTVLPTSRQN